MATAQGTILKAPGPRSVPFSLRTILALRRDPLAFMQRARDEYGDIAHYRLGRRDFFLVFSPELVKDLFVTSARSHVRGRVLQRTKRILGSGLLTSEGDFHLRQRRLMQPAFHRERIKGYARSMVEFAIRYRERWRAGETLDMHEQMMRLTLAIVAKTLFDADLDRDATQIGEALHTFMHMFRFINIPFSEFLEKLPIPLVRRLDQARAKMDTIIYRLIEERRKAGQDRGDLLSILLHAEDEEAHAGRMSNEQVRDECLTLLLAGHETTANALTWTWYLLAQNPEAEARLHAELDAVLNGRTPSADDLPQLRYTEMVLSEALRMYPPAWATARIAAQPYSMGGYQIPKNALIITSQWVVHRDPAFYPAPHAFRPERWSTDGSAARPKFSYFPFGAGPRQCIGEGFAWTEGILLLAAIAQKWKLRLAPDQQVEPLPLITLRPKYGMKMVLEQRT